MPIPLFSSSELLRRSFSALLVMTLVLMGEIMGERAMARSVVQVTPEWSAQASGTGEVLLGVSFTDSNHGYAVGTNGVIRTTANAGASWSSLTSGTSRFLRDVYFSDATHGTIVGESGLILRNNRRRNLESANERDSSTSRPCSLPR